MMNWICDENEFHDLNLKYFRTKEIYFSMKNIVDKGNTGEEAVTKNMEHTWWNYYVFRGEFHREGGFSQTSAHWKQKVWH